MGSAILAYPAMKALKKEYPSAELFFLIFEKNRASVDILKMIPEGKCPGHPGKIAFYFLIDCLKVIFRMRKEEMDCVFDLELFARITAIFSYLSAAPIRVGFHKFRMEGLYRGHLHTHRIQYNYPAAHQQVLFVFCPGIRLSGKGLAGHGGGHSGSRD